MCCTSDFVWYAASKSSVLSMPTVWVNGPIPPPTFLDRNSSFSFIVLAGFEKSAWSAWCTRSLHRPVPRWTKELIDAADIGKLRPRWEWAFTVTACPDPNTYTLALPRKMRCSPTVNVDRPSSDPGQEGENEVGLPMLLNRKAIRRVLHYLVRWRGHTSVDDEWLRAEELAHCQERMAK